jgi:hypothetical protein
MKIKLIHLDNDFGRIIYPAFRECFNPHFELEQYSAERDYDKASTVFVLNTAQDMYLNSLVSAGYKVLVENLQENSVPYVNNSPLVRYMICVNDRRLPESYIQVPWFFWYRESRLFNYQHLVRESKFDRKFLLMMNYQRSFRDYIHESFQGIADQGLYSYVARGIRLEGDIERNTKHWDRYINPDWYNRTQFSIVVETAISRGRLEVFVTEKTMKPLALRHPFITIACPTTLNFIREGGFETFGNLFDEHYDLVSDNERRVELVWQQVVDYDHQDYSQLTKEKVEYNYQRFYNKELVDKRFTQDIIHPILEFANEQA